MSRLKMIAKRNRENAQWRRFAFFPQRMLVPYIDESSLTQPQTIDRIWSIPDEPVEVTTLGGHTFRLPKDPYGRTSDL